MYKVHLCVIYFAAGLDKAMGSQWVERRGHLADGLPQPVFSNFDPQRAGEASVDPDGRRLEATLVVEVGYAFLVWPQRRARKVWCFATIRIAPGHLPVHGARLLLERDRFSSRAVSF